MTSPLIIKWAMDMANLDLESASKKLRLSPRTVKAFLDGSKTPSYDHLSRISEKFYIPIGFLFLSVPGDMRLTISDFRASDHTKVASPSLDLLETVNIAKLKQEWYREFLMREGEHPIMRKVLTKKENVPEQIRNFLDLNHLRDAAPNYKIFLAKLIEKLQENNFIVMRNSIVGNNAHRPLKVEEFKGFAIYDDYAPLIFINGKDFVSSQIFTTIHELAHVFLKESGVDNDGSFSAYSDLESECNRIAAEVLVPPQNFNYTEGCEDVLAKKYKVSKFVILIKARQMRLISYDYFYQKKQELENQFNARKMRLISNDYVYQKKQKLKQKLENQIKPNAKKSKESFYTNKKFREGGGKFLRDVITSALEGNTTFNDAYRLTGLKGTAFNKYARKLGL